MSNDPELIPERLQRGYYKRYQVCLDRGELSQDLIEQMYSFYESSIRCFRSFGIFRCRLDVPKTFKGDEDEILNLFFDTLSNQKIANNDINQLAIEQLAPGVNMLWRKQISVKGRVSFRIVLLFGATTNQSDQFKSKIKAQMMRLTRKIWGEIILVSDSNLNMMCIYPTYCFDSVAFGGSIYRAEIAKWFYLLSPLAADSYLNPDSNDNLMGAKYSNRKVPQ